jgi:hypothetical protein
LAQTSQGEHVGKVDVVQKDFEKAVEDGVIGDVIGVENHLNQDLCCPEVVGCCVENAI